MTGIINDNDNSNAASEAVPLRRLESSSTTIADSPIVNISPFTPGGSGATFHNSLQYHQHRRVDSAHKASVLEEYIPSMGWPDNNCRGGKLLFISVLGRINLNSNKSKYFISSMGDY